MPECLPLDMLDELTNLYPMQKDIAIHLHQGKVQKEAVAIEQVAPKHKVPSYCDGDFVPFFINNTYVVEEHNSNNVFIFKPNGKDSGDWFMVERNSFPDESQHDERYESNQYLVMAINEQCNAQTHVAEIKNSQVVRATDDAEYLHNIHTYIHEELTAKNSFKKVTPKM